MRIQCSGNHDLIDVDTQSHAILRMWHALGRFCDQILWVRWKVEDLNGPRQGLHRRCRIIARMRTGASIVVSATDSDDFEAISLAAECVQRAVARELERRQDFSWKSSTKGDGRVIPTSRRGN